MSPPPNVPRSSRWGLALAAGLYLSCFALGAAYALLNQRGLPAVEINPLAAGEAFERSGNLARALHEYRMVARIDRGDYTTVKRIAAVAQRAGDPSGQIDQFERARTIWPRDPATHTSLGAAYFNNRRFDDARRSFESALRLDPKRAEAQAGIGDCRLEEDRLPEAVAAFQAALALDPERAATHNSLGIAYALSGAHREAVQSFERAVGLQPGRAYAENLARARRDAAAAGEP